MCRLRNSLIFGAAWIKKCSSSWQEIMAGVLAHLDPDGKWLWPSLNCRQAPGN